MFFSNRTILFTAELSFKKLIPDGYRNIRTVDYRNEDPDKEWSGFLTGPIKCRSRWYIMARPQNPAPCCGDEILGMTGASVVSINATYSFSRISRNSTCALGASFRGKTIKPTR